MRKRLVYQILFIVIATLITVIAALANFSDTSYALQGDGARLYNRAIREISGSNGYSYTAQTEKKITTGKNTYTESLKQDITYYNSGTDGFQLTSSDTLTIGNYTINTTCQYENGTAYLNLDSSNFSATLSKAQMQKQYAPAVLLNPSHYNSVRAYPISRGTVIYFGAASAPETWAADSNMTFQQAAGIAVLDKKGALSETIYCITYQFADSIIEKAVIVTPNENKATLAQLNSQAYTPVSSLNAPLALELACGYLLQSSTLSSRTIDSITCDAFGDRYIQDITLNYSNKTEGFSASLNTALLQQNSSRGGEITETSQSLVFADGVCSVSTNNASPVADGSITQESMLQYCQDVLIGSVLLPKDISAAKFTETGNHYRYDFIATKDMATRISESACLTLYNDSHFLQNLATSYTDSGVTAYITLDKATLIPVASGISYTGTYIIDNFPYVLSYTAEQQYR